MGGPLADVAMATAEDSGPKMFSKEVFYTSIFKGFFIIQVVTNRAARLLQCKVDMYSNILNSISQRLVTGQVLYSKALLTYA